jgi:hypothetical protein
LILPTALSAKPLLKERSFHHDESRHISDAHSSKTKVVVCALAICVCSLITAGAINTATAQTTVLKTARRGLEVGDFQTPEEIDCQNRSSAENGCSDETFCAQAMLIFGSLEVCIVKLKFLRYVSISSDTES